MSARSRADSLGPCFSITRAAAVSKGSWQRPSAAKDDVKAERS